MDQGTRDEVLGRLAEAINTAEAQISAYDAESHLRCILQNTTFRQLEPADDDPTAPAGQHFTIFNTLEMTAAFTKTDDLPVHLECLTEDTTPGLTTNSTRTCS